MGWKFLKVFMCVEKKKSGNTWNFFHGFSGKSGQNPGIFWGKTEKNPGILGG